MRLLECCARLSLDVMEFGLDAVSLEASTCAKVARATGTPVCLAMRSRDAWCEARSERAIRR